MIAIDTLVLVRILVDEPDAVAQTKVARAFAKKQKTLFVPQIVQIEMSWVLSAAYKINKDALISILEHLANNEAFVLQNAAQFLAALNLFRENNISFADGLMLIESQKVNCRLVTFDKKLSKLTSVKLLSEHH